MDHSLDNITVFNVSTSDAGACMIGKYPTVASSRLAVLVSWLYSVHEGIGL